MAGPSGKKKGLFAEKKWVKPDAVADPNVAVLAFRLVGSHSVFESEAKGSAAIHAQRLGAGNVIARANTKTRGDESGTAELFTLPGFASYRLIVVAAGAIEAPLAKPPLRPEPVAVAVTVAATTVRSKTPWRATVIIDAAPAPEAPALAVAVIVTAGSIVAPAKSPLRPKPITVAVTVAVTAVRTKTPPPATIVIFAAWASEPEPARPQIPITAETVRCEIPRPTAETVAVAVAAETAAFVAGTKFERPRQRRETALLDAAEALPQRRNRFSECLDGGAAAVQSVGAALHSRHWVIGRRRLATRLKPQLR
jgi:hypothetical protein